MIERRLFDFFNDQFEAQLPAARTMEEAFQKASDQIWSDLNFVAYRNFESFNRIRKKRKATGKKSPHNKIK